MRGQILLLSGPSGSGKSTVLSRLFAEFSNVYFSISSTTRSPRAGEKDGVNYHFISLEEFEKDIKDGLFLEWARVHGNYYGTSLKPVLEALNNDKIVVFDIDVQGYFLAQKKYAKQVTSVFLTTKNATQLENRLKNRASETQESIKERLKNASKEMEYIDKYDYIIINDDVNKAYDELRAIFISICLKSSNIKADEFLKIWNNKG